MNTNWSLNEIAPYREPVENALIKPRLFNEPVVARRYAGPNNSPIFLPKENLGNPERADIYRMVSDITKALLEMLYSGKENFINSEKEHPLERYIISFDENMGNDAGLMALGQRVGISIQFDDNYYPGVNEMGEPQPEEYTTTEQFIDKMSDVIHSVVDTPSIERSPEETIYYPEIPNTNLPISIKEMIDINRKEFYKLMERAGIKNNNNLYDILYEDRLTLLSDLRRRLGQKLN